MKELKGINKFYFFYFFLLFPVLVVSLLLTYHDSFGGVNQGVYPNHQLTPGLADTLALSNLQSADWCNDHMIGTGPACRETYSQAHRSVSEATKRRVYREYGVAYPQAAGAYEVDHFYPLCGGGSNDLSNLWLEPAHVMVKGRDYGFHTKDELETALCSGIKQGSISPQEAYQRLTKDWVAYYDDLIGSGRLGGFTLEDLEGDTE